MTIKFVFVLNLFLAVCNHVSSSKLLSPFLATENHQLLTNINASDILKANRGGNLYPTSLKIAEYVKPTQADFGKETSHNKRKERSLAYDEQTPFKLNSAKAENISLSSIPVNETSAGQKVQSKRMQPNIISHPRKKDITSNNTMYEKTMETSFTKVSPNDKGKVRTDTNRYALKKEVPKDSFKTPSDSRKKLQKLDVLNEKKGHWLETGPLGKRKIRDSNRYPEELEPIFRKFFPKDFTTRETHLDSNNFRKPSDMYISDVESHGKAERYENPPPLTRMQKKKWPGDLRIGDEPFYFRAANEASTSSSKYHRTKIMTIIVPVDEQGSTMKSLSKIMQEQQDESTSAVSQTGTRTTTAARATGTKEHTATSTESQTGAETTSTVTETEARTTTAGSQTEMTTGQTGTQQTDTGQSKTERNGTEPTQAGHPILLNGALETEKPKISETISNFNPPVNYHYHFHYFGRTIPMSPPGRRKKSIMK